MSWRDRIGDGIAEWRDITLYLERGSISPGRRVQVHEYPLRDQPYVEDLGRRAREWQITGYLIGDDYDIQRNRLADALELPGAAEMRHSYYGTHRVVVTDARIQESTREGGMARVTLTVVRADDAPRFPTAVADTQQLVAAEAEASRLAILDDFLAAFDVLDLAAGRVAAIEATLLGGLAELEAAIGGVAGTISQLIRSPAELGAAILSSIGQIKQRLGEPTRALGVYRALYQAGDLTRAGAVPPAAPLEARRQAAAEVAAITFVRRAAAIESAEAAAGWALPARQEVEEVAYTLHRGLSQQLGGSVPPFPGLSDGELPQRSPEPTGDDQGPTLPAIDPQGVTLPLRPRTAQRLAALRGAIVEDLRRRGSALPELAEFTPARRLPALVIAQRLYGDAKRDAEIVRRNRIRHPGHVPAEPLEVLSE